jgi:hypothetical protein
MNWLQILMIIAGLMAFTMIVGSGLAMMGGENGLPNRIRSILIGVLLCCVVFYPLAGQACDEPLSDSELLKYYKPCYMGWCLRDEYK